MRYEPRWTTDAVSDLRAIDATSADRITRKVVWFCQQTNPLRHAEPLTGAYKGIFRFRVSDYRVLFKTDSQGQVMILMVLRVKHRREVYRQ